MASLPQMNQTVNVGVRQPTFRLTRAPVLAWCPSHVPFVGAAVWVRFLTSSLNQIKSRWRIALRKYVPDVVRKCNLDVFGVERPGMRRYPQSRFSSAMRTTKLATSSLVDGRPTPRLPLPSYFSEISFRCQAKRVSGVTMLASSARIFRPNPLARTARRRRWSSRERF